MKGMLIKDFIYLRQQIRVYLFMIAVWLGIAIGNRDMSFFGSVMMAFSVLIPISAIAYDERSKWDGYALTMPVTRTDLVMAKYLLAWLCGIGGALLAAMISAFLTGDFIASMVSATSYITVGLFLPAVILPLVFKYGVEKGRLLMMAVFLLPWMVVMILPQLNIQLNVTSLEKMFHFFPFVAIILTVGSVWLSMHIYMNKEF